MPINSKKDSEQKATLMLYCMLVAFILLIIKYLFMAHELVNSIQSLINFGKANLQGFRENEISDGYHTFDELYEFRKVYNACLFNEWAKQGKFDVHKSIRHNDNELCFGGGWFIVVAILPTGQISNHYKLADWDLFKCEEVEKAKFEFDGHTPNDVLIRLKSVI